MKEVVVIWRCFGQWLHKDNCNTQKIIITKDYGLTLDKKRQNLQTTLNRQDSIKYWKRGPKIGTTERKNSASHVHFVPIVEL